MGGFSVGNIALLIIAIIILYSVVKFLKGLIRGVLTLVIVFTLGISLYNIFIAQKPLSYEINRYKTDITYFKNMNNVNKEAYDCIKNIKENKDIPNNVKRLEAVEKDAEALNHSEETNLIHDKYIANFKNIVSAAKAYETANNAKEKLNELKDLESKIDMGFLDVIFPKK